MSHEKIRDGIPAAGRARVKAHGQDVFRMWSMGMCRDGACERM